MRRSHALFAASVAAAIASGACSLLVGVDGLADGPSGGAPDVSDAAGERAVADAPVDSPADTASDAIDAATDAPVDAGSEAATDAATDAAPPPITFVSASLAQPLTNVTSIALNKPAGVVSGDVVLVGLFTDVASTVALTPAGYTKLGDLPGFADIHGWFYVRTVSATEPSSTTFTFNSTPFASAIGIAYRNVRSPNPVDVASYATSASNPLIATSITTTLADAMVVGIYLADDTLVAQWFAPSGMTLRGQTGIAAAFDSPFVSPGTTGARLATNDQNVAAVTALIALAPK